MSIPALPAFRRSAATLSILTALSILPASETELAPAAADVFLTPGGLQVRFLRGEGNRITGLTVSNPQARNVRFEKRAG